MGKGRIFGSIAIVASIVALATWSGCGGGGSNDQGVSFRALGFFADGTGNTGDSGRCASLRDTTNIPNDTDGDGTLDGAFMGLQNSMLQGINVDHVNLSYHINGSNLAIPNDVFALSVRLGPVNNAEPNPPTRFAQVMVVGPAIMKFINDNSSRLPDLPFTLVASASAVGAADNSDNFSTNRVNYSVVFSALSGGCANPTPTPGESLEGETGTGG